MNIHDTFKWLFYEGEHRNGMVAGEERRVRKEVF